MVKRIIYYRFGSKDVHLPKMIGAFLLIFSLLMFMKAGAGMFDSWDAIKEYPECVAEANSLIEDQTLPSLLLEQKQLAQMKFNQCRNSFYEVTGVMLHGNQGEISTRQTWNALLGPIAGVFFWAMIFLVGLVAYSTGNLMVPIEQTTAKPRKKKK